MGTGNLIKDVLGKKFTKLYLLIGITLMKSCSNYAFFSFLSRKQDKFMNNLRFKNLHQVIIITHSTIQ